MLWRVNELLPSDGLLLKCYIKPKHNMIIKRQYMVGVLSLNSMKIGSLSMSRFCVLHMGKIHLIWILLVFS